MEEKLGSQPKQPLHGSGSGLHTWHRGGRGGVSHGQGDRKNSLVSDSESQSLPIIGKLWRFPWVSVWPWAGHSPSLSLDFSKRTEGPSSLSRHPVLQRKPRGHPHLPQGDPAEANSQRDLGRVSFSEPGPQDPRLGICIKKPQATQQLQGRNICGYLSTGREPLLLKQLFQCILYNSYKTWFS